jgi:sugar phosphate isomerase/epimerase
LLPVASTTAAGVKGVTDMAGTTSIKRGVSLYSFQEEYFLGKMNLEQCIAKAATLGALGIESLAEQMMPGFPKLSEQFYRQWDAWMAKYGTTSVCHDMFLDTKLHKDRLLTEQECIESFVRDLKHAQRIGAKVMRVLVFVSPELLEKCLPYAEQYDIKMGIEVHAPWHFDHPWIMRHAEMIQRTGTRHAGFIPDFGIFTKRLPRVVRDKMLRNGATEKIVSYVCQAYEDGVLAEYVVAEARNMGGNPVDISFAEQCRHNVWSNPKRMLEFMPWIFHIHAKFYEMLDNGTEYSIPYERIVPVLQQGGYDGYLSSEYEGNRHIQDAFAVDSVEQVRRQHEMFKRLLNETA